MPIPKGQANKRLLVGIVLDRSSSMLEVKAETISGTNEQFSALRDSDDAANTFVTLFSFNHMVTPVFKNDEGAAELVPCSDLKDISDADYFPSGMTAMYDGVGDIIDFFTKEAKKADDVLIVVISDGEENKSSRFTSDQISSRVKELQDSGWNFTYIGANQDLTQVQSNLGIHDSNMLKFEASSSGVQAMNTTVSTALRSYTSNRSSHIASGSTARFASKNLYDAGDGGVGDSVGIATTVGTDQPVVTDTITTDPEDVKESQAGTA